MAASTNSETQDLMDRCVAFGEWAGFRFNAEKCAALCMVNQTLSIYVDNLFTPLPPILVWIPSQHLSGTTDTGTLGVQQGAPRTWVDDLDVLKEALVRDTAKVFKSPLAEWQKLDAYHRFRLTFVFQVIFPGSTWCRKMDTALRAIVKQGLSLPRRTCTHYFYLPQSLGGLGIPIAEDEQMLLGWPRLSSSLETPETLSFVQ